MASAEVARRSQSDDGAASLARREGFASPARLVASATGGSTAEAHRLIAVGQATLAAESSAPHIGSTESGSGESGSADVVGAERGSAEGGALDPGQEGVRPAARLAILARAVRAG